ncbi:MAG: hypothetical protein PHR53_03335 [Bacteroidales bacterium]|nr:hypothetical protein [Bacteroidales bacterium]
MKINYNIMITIALLMLNIALEKLSAQTDTTQKTQVEKMTIIGIVEPTIEHAKKPEINPEIKDETVDFPKPEYQLQQTSPLATYNQQNSFPFYPLPKYQPTDENHRNYLILGFANYWTPLAEFYANMNAHREHAFGIHLKHLSSQGGIDNYAKSAYSHNNIDAYYKYMGRNFIVKTDLFFDRDVVHYYGFNPTEWEETGRTLPSNDSIKQRYALLGGNVQFSNNSSRPIDFQYYANLGFSNFSDRYQNRENQFTADFSFKKGFKWFRFSDYQTLGTMLSFNYYDEKASDFFYTESINTMRQTMQNNAWKLSLLPFIGAAWDEYYIRLGVDLALTSTENKTVFHVHPAIEAKVKLITEKLDIFAGLGGNIERNSMKMLVEENPFLAPSMAFTLGDATFLNKKITIYGGINANILEGWDLKAGANYSYIDNMPFYTIDSQWMIPTYQPFFANTNELNVFLNTNYSFSNKISAQLNVDFYSYTSKSFQYAYYKPNFKISFIGEYCPIPKLKINLGFRFYSKMWAYNGNASEASSINPENNIQLPCLYDLNLGGEYKIWKELYGFLQMSNVIAQNYQQFLYYPTQGITLMVGAKFRF